MSPRLPSSSSSSISSTDLMFRVHEKESGSQHDQCSSIAVLAFFVVIRTLSLRWKCLEMVRTALEAGLPRPAQAHQRLALLAAATRAKVFPLPEALAVAAVGRRHGQGRQRQAQGRRQGQERFSWASAPWMNALEPLAPLGLTLLRVRFDHGAVANGVALHAVVSHAGSGAAIWPMASPPEAIPSTTNLHGLKIAERPLQESSIFNLQSTRLKNLKLNLNNINFLV